MVNCVKWYWYWSASVKRAGGVHWWMKEGCSQATGCGQCFMFFSVLWHCWLGDKKDIRPVKNPFQLSQKVLFREHTHTNVLRPFFWDHLWEPVPEEIFWTFMVQGKITEDNR